MNPRSLKNLKPFTKGNKASPGRTPIPESVKQFNKNLKDMNASVALDLIESGEYEKLLKETLRNNAKTGRLDGIKFINDYNGNKPGEKIEIDNTKYEGLDDEILKAARILQHRKNQGIMAGELMDKINSVKKFKTDIEEMNEERTLKNKI